MTTAVPVPVIVSVTVFCVQVWVECLWCLFCQPTHNIHRDHCSSHSSTVSDSVLCAGLSWVSVTPVLSTHIIYTMTTAVPIPVLSVTVFCVQVWVECLWHLSYQPHTYDHCGSHSSTVMCSALCELSVCDMSCPLSLTLQYMLYMPWPLRFPFQYCQWQCSVCRFELSVCLWHLSYQPT